MAPHRNGLAVFDGARSYGKDVAHLVDLDFTPYALTLCDQPVSHLLVFLRQGEAAHTRTS